MTRRINLDVGIDPLSKDRLANGFLILLLVFLIPFSDTGAEAEAGARLSFLGETSIYSECDRDIGNDFYAVTRQRANLLTTVLDLIEFLVALVIFFGFKGLVRFFRTNRL